MASANLAEYINNLRFFIRHGVGSDNGCSYVIVIQQVCVRAVWYHTIQMFCTERIGLCTELYVST